MKLLRWLPDWLSKVTGFCCEKLCTSSGVKLLRWLPHLVLTIIGFCCESLHQLWWNFYGDCLTDYLRLLGLAAKFCTSSGVKLLRWLPEWQPTPTGFCCETLHQFMCETFTVIAWLTTYDYWLLLRNFAPVVVWNFYVVCLTDYLRLLAFAAKLCTSSGVKLLRWLPDWLLTITCFCCETLHQFWCETFMVIAWLTTYDYWLLLRIFCTSSGLKLLRWLPDWLPTTTGFCCETSHQFWCETFTVISSVTAYHYWLLLRNVAPVLWVNLLWLLPDWLPTSTGFSCEILRQFWCETFTLIAWLTI